jgi:hypothetical protein
VQLVLSEETEHGMRFAMLETLREFGQEQFSAEEQGFLRRRHAEFFLQWACPCRVRAQPLRLSLRGA